MIGFFLSEDGPVARRVFNQFVWNIFLPRVVILGLPLVLLAVYGNLDKSVWPALIAGVVFASGWLVTIIFAQLGRARDKAERLRDMHKALYAEIRNAQAGLISEGEAVAQRDRIIELMEKNPSFAPFISKEQYDRVFSALVRKLDVLPRLTIDPIVAYYSMISSIFAMAEDMRSDTFKSLSQDRRILMYQDYFDMRLRAHELGDFALGMISEYSENAAAAADELSKKLNTQGAAQNGHQQG